jgi:hypothetical protein
MRYFIVGSRTDELITGESTIIRVRDYPTVKEGYLYHLTPEQIGSDWQKKHAPYRAISFLTRWKCDQFWSGWTDSWRTKADGSPMYEHEKEIDKKTVMMMIKNSLLSPVKV